MSNEFDFSVEAPTLVFEPVKETMEDPQAIKEAETYPEEQEAIQTLTPQELKMVEDFSKNIDLNNYNAVLEYGAGTQKKMSDFSDAALQHVRTKDLGEVGELLSSLVTELKEFDEEEEKKGLFGIFKKGQNKAETLKARYDKAEVNVNNVVKVMETHQTGLLKDIAMLDKMYEANQNYFKELSMYILAGKKKLTEFRANELAVAIERAQQSSLPEDAQKAKDLEDMADRFEKKIHDLELTRMVALQTAPQIRLLQNNDSLMVEKIQSSIVNTIPLWKNQMVLALGIDHSAQAAKAQREVTDMTNSLLKKNAEMLKEASIEIAQESERGVVDIDTLTKTNENLISTFDEVMKIQAEGREKRKAAEAEMERIEEQLKAKLLEISNRK